MPRPAAAKRHHIKIPKSMRRMKQELTNFAGVVLLASLMSCLIISCGPSETPSQADGEESNTESTAPTLKWDISLWGNPRAATEGAESLARRAAERTDGAWQITLHYGEALSKSRENLDGLFINAFEGAMFCSIYHPRKTPALMVLSLPFLPMTDWDDNRKVRDAIYVHPAIVEEAKRWNAMLYVSSFLPSNEIMGRGEAPKTLADWKGMTVRAGGGMGKALQHLGATPTSSTATEVYTGVQQGTMDAAAFPFTYAHVVYRIHEVTDWYTSNMRIGTSDCPIAFSIDAYESLPNDYKQLLTEIKEDVIKDQIAAYIEADETNLAMLQAELEEVVYSQEEIQQFRDRAGQPVIDEWIAENQDDFDALGLVETVYQAVGMTYGDTP